MKIKLFFILLLTGMGISVFAQNEGQEGIVFMENQPWSEVLQKAKEQNRLIFMDCYTVWCGPCKGLAKDIFPQKKVGDFFNANFVNAKYDMEKGDGKMLREKYKEYIIGFPTLLLIDQNGNVVHQMAGYHKADELIAGMKAGLEGKTLAAMQKKYESGARDFETIRDYVAALNGAFKKDEIRNILTDYLKIIPVEKLQDRDMWTLVGRYVVDPYSEAYRYVFDHIEKFQYRLDVDRYRLESQLEGGMSNAVKDIIEVTTRTTNPDTLKMMADRETRLREMLEKNTVKRFPTLLCKLTINDYRLKGDALGMYNMLNFADQLNILNYESAFRSATYRYIVCHVRDKKILNDCLKTLIALQDQESLAKSKLITQNYYDVIALTYEKLGQKVKAAEAKEKFEQLEKEKKAEMAKFFNLGEKDEK